MGGLQKTKAEGYSLSCSRPLGEMTQLFLIPPLISLPGGRRNLHQIDLRCCAHLLGMGVV